ncbi:DNA polymerase Y subunit UmuC family protein [Burkholderia glumae]|uniref:Uncharacterized protein n=1 Tax=Burkholderia glumae TaxID=337 RepID=A0AAQ0BUZ6_BURGL|nr:hypothetical protein [Burkholderia glumae]AJY62501.1 impB/mucB/samB family protein [Burkholderia glumae LMG 2196 = ATCC 33617]QPQ94794.1 hypothetical protein I6H06_29755 [Burkholderia glumae]QQM89308.1 hypothetical protein I6G78_00810 [Burkholderia glumae]
MAVFVAIFLPGLSLDVFRPRWSPRTEHGCVVLEGDKVLVADSKAREAGVLPGMKRGGVISRSPDALLYDRSVEPERDMQREVAFGMLRFSPQVAVCDEETIAMDVTANLLLFGGVRRITVRQRPGTAKGVIFLTIEDETGNVNVTVCTSVQEKFRQEVLGIHIPIFSNEVEKLFADTSRRSPTTSPRRHRYRSKK